MSRTSSLHNNGTFRSKLTALGLLLTLTVLAGTFAIGPYLRSATLETEISSMKALLTNLDHRLNRATKETAAKSDRSASARIGSVFVTGETAGIAGAELQSRLAKRVRQHGGVVKTLLVKPARSTSNPNIVTVKVSASISIKGLREIIYEIETSKPLLFIDNIAIAVARTHGLQQTIDGPVRLNVELQVSGFRKGRLTS